MHRFILFLFFCTIRVYTLFCTSVKKLLETDSCPFEVLIKRNIRFYFSRLLMYKNGDSTGKGCYKNLGPRLENTVMKIWNLELSGSSKIVIFAVVAPATGVRRSTARVTAVATRYARSFGAIGLNGTENDFRQLLTAPSRPKTEPAGHPVCDVGGQFGD